MWNELILPGLAPIAALSVQVGLLVALVYALSLVVRRGPAEVRYVLWLTVALRLCWPAGLESPLGLAPTLVGLERAADATESGTWAADRSTRSTGEVSISLVRTKPSPAALDTAADAERAVPPLALVWLAGVGIMMLHFARRWWWARRFVAACEPNRREDLARRFDELKQELGLRPGVELRVDSAKARLEAPAVFGLWRPVVLLPRSVVDSWRLEEIEPVLIHEMVHLRRLDLPINALQCVLQAVYFFHPLVWLMNRKIREERELICDDEVVRRCGGRSGYVRAILRVVESQAVASRFAPAMGMASHRSSLGRRVERLLDRGYRQVERRWPFAVSAFLVGLLCVGVVSGRQAEVEYTARPAWSEEVEALFALDPDEDLRLVDPATFRSRLDFYRALHPRQAAAVPEGPRRISFAWDSQRQSFGPPRLSFGKASLGQLLHLLGIESYAVEGATEWLSEPVVGDLVVRSGADLETLLGALSEELVERHRLPLNLELRHEMREVVIARGTYRVTGDQVRVGEPFTEPTDSEIECQEFPVRRLDAGLRMLSGLLRQPVIDEVVAPDRDSVEWLFRPSPQRDRERLLASLARQTSLRFDEEARRLPVVVITETGAGANL